MSCITIYTDASVCPETKTGAWSCWIKAGPGDTATFSGAFKSPVADSTDAELMAIVNALAIAKKAFAPLPKIIVVVTDSQYSINYIAKARVRKSHLPSHKKKSLREVWFALAKSVLATVPEGCELRVNKVKAHSSKDGRRSYVNSVVDKESRKVMRKARAMKAGA